MATKTKTETSHWHVQWERRDKFRDDWAKNRRTVIRGEDLDWRVTANRMREAVYMSEYGGNPTRTLDATIHQVLPGTTSTMMRHSWDAILFMTEGSGWVEVDGRRYDWSAWDAVHIPAWAWHRHGNDGDSASTFLSSSSEPILTSLGLGFFEDAGDTPFEELPARPSTHAPVEGDDWYSNRINKLAEHQKLRAAERIHTDYDDQPLRVNPKGTRSKFLNDPSLGNFTSGLTQVMLQFAPGYRQSMHRHPGEAWLYVVEGEGYSYLGAEPEGGETYHWKAGDLVVVDHYLWHQHFNDSKDKPARIVRIHAFGSLLDTLTAIMHPMPMFEEMLETAPDVSGVEWPGDDRPSS
ncbi:MAG: cupin domain-containing protein [Roseovarius sp.]|jgi:gentisate 1,2-dioxygenase|nr:cupin domain-containing protein [Roseovarius sp.]